jgi:selenocysteine lyase/cysteine desulfurase
VSMAAVEAYEDGLRARIEAGIADLPGITVYSRAAQRTPTLLLGLGGREQEAYAFLAERGVNAPAGSFYALEASRRLGLGDTGALRVGLAPYVDDGDVDRLLAALAAFTGA